MVEPVKLNVPPLATIWPPVLFQLLLMFNVAPARASMRPWLELAPKLAMGKGGAASLAAMVPWLVRSPPQAIRAEPLMVWPAPLTRVEPKFQLLRVTEEPLSTISKRPLPLKFRLVTAVVETPVKPAAAPVPIWM